MISAGKWKYYRSLKQKKYRRREGKCLLEGINLCEAALQSGFGLELLLVAQTAAGKPEFEKLVRLAESRAVPVEVVSDRDLRTLCETVTPQGAVGVGILRGSAAEIGTTGAGFVLLLDRISDPGNLGTLLRTAEWFGVREVACSPGSAELFSGKVLRASAGALFFLPHVAWDADLLEIGQRLLARGYQIFVADVRAGTPLPRVVVRDPNRIALVLGSERHGPGAWVNKLQPRFVHIPGRGKCDSLNVAVAGAILISHFCLDKT